MQGNKKQMQDKMVIGWREWVQLPELNIPSIKVKLDTGARTSALHVTEIEPFEAEGRLQVRFVVPPVQKVNDIFYECTADVLGQRIVKNSGGQTEKRYVILTPIRLGDQEWPIEITLTSREDMLFRMLLGRAALRHRFVVDPGTSFLMGRI